MNKFLPINRNDMVERGWDELDFIFVTGDAYVDHPSFGAAILSRLLVVNGYKVGIVSQPQRDEDFLKMGEPKYAFLVSSGNVDSMVAHYTVAKRRREKDSYSPGGKMGLRPDRAVTVYTKRIREISGKPIIIGGIEASLRRFAHYDYWKDEVLPSVLEQSGADLLVYGMGERALIEIARRFSEGKTVLQMQDIRGICYLVEPNNTPFGCKECPSFSQVSSSKKAYAKSCKIQYYEQDEELHQALTQIGTGVFSPAEPGRYRDLLDSLINFGDHYQVLADYRSYVDCQDRVDELYQHPEEWAYKAMLNIANMGYFSSDRTIQEYAKYIWHIDPVRL